MRTITAGEETLLDGANYAVFQRTKVANGDGTLIDLSDYVERVTIDEDIDQPTAQATVEFRRDASSTLSLAPLRTDSTLNRLNDGTTYSPQLDAGRLITVEVATVAIGSTPGVGDWKELFRGYLDSVDAATPTVTTVSRDLGGVLVDRWIETEKAYGYDTDISVVMQAILDDTLGSGVVTLTTTGTPAFNIKTYTQQSESLMDALRTLAELIGWDVRYKWNGSAFVLTLYEPPRSNTTPLRTFGPSAYHEVTRLSLDRVDVRNVITIDYPSGTSRATLTTTDSTSITRYGRRFMGITEATESSVDTLSEAGVLIGNILSDLKDPKAEQEIEAQFFWPAELGDLYRFSANSVHYNTNQDWAATNIRHDLYGGTGRTYLQVRGTPAGGFLSWIAKAKSPGGAIDDDGWIEIEAEIGRETTHAVGTASQGWTEEARQRSGSGGYAVPGARIHAEPIYDSLGEVALVDTTTKKITTDLLYNNGTGIEALRPAEAGAEVTTGKSLTLLVDRTAANVSYVSGGVTVESLKPAEAGANVTETRTSADTSAVAGTAAATVKSGAARGQGGFSNETGGLVATAAESGGKAVNRLYAKALAGDADSFDSVADGTTYKRITGVSGGLVQTASVAALAITDAKVNDMAAGKMTAGTLVSGVNESGGKAINRLLGKALAGDADSLDGVVEGTTYKRTTANEKTGAGRGYSGLDASNLVALDVPRAKAVANVPGIDLTSGTVDKGTAFDTGEEQAGLRDTSKAAGVAAQGWSEEARIRSGSGGYAAPGARIHAEPWYDSTGATPLFDPSAQTFTGKKIIGGGSTPTLGSVDAFWSSSSIVGTDTSGRVDLDRSTVGTSNTGVQFRVTFATAYAAAPHVLLSTLTSSPGAAVQPITVTPTATYFEVSFYNTCGIGTVAIFYHVIA